MNHFCRQVFFFQQRERFNGVAFSMFSIKKKFLSFIAIKLEKCFFVHLVVSGINFFPNRKIRTGNYSYVRLLLMNNFEFALNVSKISKLVRFQNANKKIWTSFLEKETCSNSHILATPCFSSSKIVQNFHINRSCARVAKTFDKISIIRFYVIQIY